MSELNLNASDDRAKKSCIQFLDAYDQLVCEWVKINPGKKITRSLSRKLYNQILLRKLSAMKKEDPKIAPKLPRNSIAPWGYEHMTKMLVSCSCGGAPVLIQGGSPTTYRYYCQNTHSKGNKGRPCNATTRECESLSESVYEWNCLQGKRGVDLRCLHPLNMKIAP